MDQTPRMRARRVRSVLVGPTERIRNREGSWLSCVPIAVSRGTLAVHVKRRFVLTFDDRAWTTSAQIALVREFLVRRMRVLYWRD
jgi:hypothetical protein